MSVNGAKLARTCHAKLDVALGKLLELAKEKGDTPPCRAGCAWCCSEPVYAGRQEAQLIVRAIGKMPPEERVRITEAIQAWVKRFEASPLIREKEPHVSPYRALKLPCPLLSADNQCTVYEDRPMGCRSHIARADSRLCEDDALRLTQQFLMPPGEVLAAGMAEMFMAGTELDHLVLLLHRQIFGGEAPKSGAWVGVEIEE